MNEKNRSARKRLSLFFWACLISVIVAVVMGITVLALYFVGVTRPSTSIVLICLSMTIAVAGSVIAAVMSRVILQPVEQLSRASQRIAKGDFDVQLEYNGSIRELRDTYESFNSMARELGAIETLREDFIANVSHEFKTPLTAMEGYAMLLQDESLSPTEQQECVQRIIGSTGRLSTLVSNILLLSKLEQNTVDMPRTFFRLDEQLRQALLQLEPAWSEKELNLEVELAEVRYDGCERLLYHVWANLLSNAVKFSPPGGTLSLTMKEGNGVEVTIGDQGPGMSSLVQRHMFDKFYQGDSSRKQEGSGLGLALVWRILQLCGGEIAVESREGRGSRFTVILPKG